MTDVNSDEALHGRDVSGMVEMESSNWEREKETE